MLNPQNTPQAKPVKIRIMSGGEEHSSLDTLLRNFDVNDIKKVMDGRLSRWLETLGQKDMATKINAIGWKISYSESELLQIVKLLFSDEETNYCSTLAELVDVWIRRQGFEKNCQNLFEYIYANCDAETLLKLYNNKHKYSFVKNWQALLDISNTERILKWFKEKDKYPFISDWASILEVHLNERNPSIWFAYGIMKNDKHYIMMAADAGSKEASIFIKNKVPNIRVDIIKSIINNEKIDPYSLTTEEQELVELIGELYKHPLYGTNFKDISKLEQQWKNKNQPSIFLNIKFGYLCALRLRYQRVRSSTYSYIQAVKEEAVNMERDFSEVWSLKIVQHMNNTGIHYWKGDYLEQEMKKFIRYIPEMLLS